MHFSSIRTTLLLLFVTFFLPIKGVAWNALGHMVIANIAYQHLTPTAKSNVDKLVGYFSKEYPNMPSLLQMAVWPDAVRSQKIDTFTRWHYVDIPFSDDFTGLHDTVSSDNAVWALTTIKQVVRNEQANVFERARFLAFVVHIAGDLHQPLHTVTRITSAHPEGDRGGNLFKVKWDQKKMSLHQLWDGGVGVLNGPAKVDESDVLAKSLMTRYPENFFGDRTKELSLVEWKKEGMKNATTYVYNTEEEKPLGGAYINAGRKVAEEEITLAGYRLGRLLNQLLG